MKNLIREIRQEIRLNQKNMLIFEVLYRLSSLSIYLWMVKGGLRFALNRAGYSYLTPGNALRFLMKPWTLPVLLLLAAAGLFLLMIEIGGLVTAYAGAAYSLRVKPFDILLGGVGKAADEVRKRNFRLFGIGFVTVLFLNLLFFMRLFSHTKPVGFIMEEADRYFLTKWGVRALPLLCLIAVIPTVFVFHECMLERKGCREACRRSRDLMARDLRRTGACLGMGYLLVIVGAVLCYLAVMTVATIVAHPLVNHELEMIFLMDMSDRIEGVILFMASIFMAEMYFAVVTVQYCRLSEREAGPDIWAATVVHDETRRRNGRVLLVVIGCLGAVCILDAHYNGSFLSQSVVVEIGITAHRGSSLSAPGNTMAAIEKAVDELADRAEIDVQESKDGYVVVCHDRNLRSVAGINRRVSDMTLDELRQADVGRHFSAEYAGETIPTLDEVMEYARGRIDLNIELKNEGNQSDLPEKVLKLVYDHDMMAQCIITSTNLRYLEQVKELDPEIRTGYILSAAYGRSYENDAVDILSIRSDFVTQGLVDSAHEAGKAVHAWTVNSKMELERMKALNVDDVITDNPVLAREILYREEATETLLEYLRMIWR